MEFNIQKTISNFIENQFPQFYKEEGENFILFTKAYYEWLESSGKPVFEARNIFDYRDIDNTLEEFLEFFQKKYLYGIPFNVIANKRFLLKHILDVYRSKGSIQCYRLLFKLLYNEDVEIYFPGRDLLRPSDGTWKEPKYLELTNSDLTNTLIGKRIVGSSSGTSATVESFVKEAYNNSIINVIYISNIEPKGRDFDVGEKILEQQNLSNTVIVSQSPTVLGSLDRIDIINGGQNFAIGDIIKIVYRDVSNNDVISFGKEGLLRVTNTTIKSGSIKFNISDGGFGFTSNALTFVYKSSANGQGASFEVGGLASVQNFTYNTDLICDYMDLQLDVSSYGFPSNSSANLSSSLQDCLSYQTDTFGEILSLANTNSGEEYDSLITTFVRSTQLSNTLPGTISYNNSSNTVTGSSTIFDYVFANDDVIALQSNSSISSLEFAVIKEVTNSSQIILYGPPTTNGSSAYYRASPTILPSQYAIYEEPMYSIDGSINGENEEIFAFPGGTNSISETYALDSGKGYVEGEIVKAYLHAGISPNLLITSSGINYANNEEIIFSGGRPGIVANGYITTDGSGSITSATLVNAGSGYEFAPEVRIRTANGSGGSIQATLQEFNTVSEITGRVRKSGLGRGKGYWKTTDSFLNSDKYIQDSYYYQDYSYEIKTARTLSKYKDIIYSTFHNAGTELFGKYLKLLETESNNSIIEESFSSYTDIVIYLLSSETDFTCDNDSITVDKYFV